jgi:hypothetical protein
LRQDTKLFRCVSKEADSTATTQTVLAWLSPITSRVEPALENSVSELTGIALLAVSFTKIRACSAGVVVLPGIPTASLLTGMGKGTLCPVM